ncbi:MAG: 16S rRNA (guanine(966)-N(2))-methyltransferase RsmD [Nitrospinae bacterium]|nr:16S rRNA (guanine(966)-N(2))-methyltransferase RsmD [Nitrospinota bacterium]
MRVIGGRAKGRRLTAFKGSDIRPTLDRVKESFVNQVRPFIQGASVLDLFAGTGNIGIELLSQGAARAVFVEPHAKAADLVRRNLEKCGFGKGAADGDGPEWEVLRTNALNAIRLLDKRGLSFDLVYIDPPFDEDLYEETLLALSASGLLGGDSMAVAEHRRKNPLREIYGKLALFKSRRVGDTCLSFYGPGHSEDPSES